MYRRFIVIFIIITLFRFFDGFCHVFAVFSIVGPFGLFIFFRLTARIRRCCWLGLRGRLLLNKTFQLWQLL